MVEWQIAAGGVSLETEILKDSLVKSKFNCEDN